MKKNAVLFLLLFFSTLEICACDICGCGGGNFYLGMLPQFKSKFIGIRYHFAQYHTVLASDASQFSRDDYHSAELWGGWNLGEKWQVLAFVPYYFNRRQDDDGVSYKSGLGDITVLANYRLFHSQTQGGGRASKEQSFWIGAGVKLSTGSFHINPSDPSTTIADINAQIGTGSTDLLLNAMHMFRINRIGVNTTMNYKIGTQNSAGYKFGNRLSANSIAWYKTNIGGLGVLPNLGISYEKTSENRLQKQAVDLTGSYLTGALAGVECVISNQLSVGLNVQVPLAQSYAGGQTQNRIKGMAHITFSL